MTTTPAAVELPAKTQQASHRRAGSALLALACAGYLAQSFTPLRLTGDVTTYLSMASSAARGLGFTRNGEIVGYPPGYPMLVWALERMGLGTSLVLNLFNLAALVIALLALRSIARTRGTPGSGFSAIIACLFSYVVVKHAALQLTDTAFLGITTVSIALAERAVEWSGRRAAVLWVCAFVAAMLGITLRAAGIITLPVLLFECWRTEFRSRNLISRRAAIVFGLAIVAVAGAGFRWASSGTKGLNGTNVSEHLQRLTRRSFVDVIGPHIIELGALGLNIPPSKVASGGKPFFYAAGFAVAGLTGLGLRRSRHRWAPGSTFLLCYSLMVLVWPETVDPRFWLPVIPLVALEIVAIVSWMARASHPVPRLIGRSYPIYFVLTGAIALGYSVRLTVSHDAFLEAPANDHWKATYEAWLRPRAESLPAGADPEILSLLREYGGRR